MPQSVQNNNLLQKPVVVYSLLDWGLGHTTRSIPIIRHLIALNCNVLVACNSNQKLILLKEFPEINYKELGGYELRYATKGWLTILYIILQVPKILIKINKENRWLKGFLLENKVDFIVSDNRFGFFSSKIPSIFITHQLSIRTGLGSWADKLIRLFNYRYINHFTACWVPDYPEKDGLAGKLSHPATFPAIPIHYLGPVSRFVPCRPATESKQEILIILSGPEPQRTILEFKILFDVHLMDKTNRRFVLVRGLPAEAKKLYTTSPIEIFNHLPTTELNRYLCTASLVVSRAGYTSIMDYMKLGVRAVLIPTPGQAEQQYLAQHLHQSGLALAIEQKKFSLQNALQQASSFHFKKAEWDMESYKSIINEYLNSQNH